MPLLLHVVNLASLTIFTNKIAFIKGGKKHNKMSKRDNYGTPFSSWETNRI